MAPSQALPILPGMVFGGVTLTVDFAKLDEGTRAELANLITAIQLTLAGMARSGQLSQDNLAEYVRSVMALRPGLFSDPVNDITV